MLGPQCSFLMKLEPSNCSLPFFPSPHIILRINIFPGSLWLNLIYLKLLSYAVCKNKLICISTVCLYSSCKIYIVFLPPASSLTVFIHGADLVEIELICPYILQFLARLSCLLHFVYGMVVFCIDTPLQDMLGPDGMYGQGPPSVHSSHGGRPYQQQGRFRCRQSTN
jgi:hypothetical protein